MSYQYYYYYSGFFPGRCEQGAVRTGRTRWRCKWVVRVRYLLISHDGIIRCRLWQDIRPPSNIPCYAGKKFMCYSMERDSQVPT